MDGAYSWATYLLWGCATSSPSSNLSRVDSTGNCHLPFLPQTPSSPEKAEGKEKACRTIFSLSAHEPSAEAHVQAGSPVMSSSPTCSSSWSVPVGFSGQVHRGMRAGSPCKLILRGTQGLGQFCVLCSLPGIILDDNCI